MEKSIRQKNADGMEKLESMGQKQEKPQEKQRRRRSVRKAKGDGQQDTGERVRSHVRSQAEYMQVRPFLE